MKIEIGQYLLQVTFRVLLKVAEVIATFTVSERDLPLSLSSGCREGIFSASILWKYSKLGVKN